MFMGKKMLNFDVVVDTVWEFSELYLKNIFY